MTSPASSCPDIWKRKSHEIYHHALESFPNDKSLSDFLLYKGNRDHLNAISHWTSASEEKVLGERDIDAWLDQQEDKSTTATILDTVDGFDFGSVSEYNTSTQPSSPGTSSQASPSKRPRRDEPRQQGDVPHTLREVGAFADSSVFSGEEEEEEEEADGEIET
ncbi:hypothetical protein BDP81DRAFT_392927 [Colletotrichum phormii]|uniref:Uncharacterized protein n=1 Tax=Colletotrichum phormii TaxID=359342 RepID=A0AAI9ZUE4_9PEZI|nr:uncharacterized protein BDP81DRAFT_392927 [Colletotrichum phormii]KAK1638323.1 hypothetical protein BDP81DRAFT_392927 [Colletotrichum phormii]